MGRSSFALPWLVHFHAWVMMGWVGLYLAQNALIFSDNVALHRRLGWLAVMWLPAIAGDGRSLITRFSLQTGGGPPFFDQNQFLISNPLQLLGFVGLAGWAVTVRKNTGWHRRLMFCALRDADRTGRRPAAAEAVADSLRLVDRRGRPAADAVRR